MSIEAVAWYLDNSDQDGPRLLALLALAERADVEGSCYPGMASIAKRLRRSERRAKAVIAELEQAGELLVVPGVGPRTQGGYLSRYYLLAYMDANGYTVPPEHAELATERRQADRTNGQLAQATRKGVKELTPLLGTENIKKDAEGVSIPSPLREEKRGEGFGKGVKVLTRRGEGSDTKGVSEPSPKPLDKPSVEPSVNNYLSDPEKCDPEQQQWFAAMCWIVYGHQDYKLLSKTDRIAIGKTVKDIRGSPKNYTLDDLREWFKDKWSQEWPGKQPGRATIQRPTLKQVKSGIGRVKETEVYVNGNSQRSSQASEVFAEYADYT